MINSRMRGFTLAELLIVIVAITILFGLASVTYLRVQKDSNDSIRNARASIIAEALENYYEKHNEYPSVPSVADRNAAIVKGKLNIPDSSVLSFPGTDAAESVIVSSGPSTDRILYDAGTINPDENDQCVNEANGYCDNFTLTYRNEVDGSLVTIKSRHSSGPIAIGDEDPPAPEEPTAPPVPLSPPSSPDVQATAATTSASVTWARSSGKAPITYQVSYKRTADPTYSVYASCSSLSGTSCNITGLTQNTAYTFRVVATNSDGTAEGYATATTPLSAPNTPTVPSPTNSTSGTVTTWTWNAVSCNVGAAEYQYTYTYDGGPAYTYTTTTRSIPYTTNSQGQRYLLSVSARCVNGTFYSNWSAVSGQSAYTRPITSTIQAANGELILFVPQPPHNQSAIWGRAIVDWIVGTCPSGTSYMIEWYWAKNYGGAAGGWVLGGAYKDWFTTGWFVYGSDLDAGNTLEYLFHTRCQHYYSGTTGPMEYADVHGNVRVESNRNQSNGKRGSWSRNCGGAWNSRNYSDTAFCYAVGETAFRKF